MSNISHKLQAVRLTALVNGSIDKIKASHARGDLPVAFCAITPEGEECARGAGWNGRDEVTHFDAATVAGMAQAFDGELVSKWLTSRKPKLLLFHGAGTVFMEFGAQGLVPSEGV